MCSMNSKIFNESKIDEGKENTIIANMPDFEFQYFTKLQKGDKPYNAICMLNDSKFIITPQYSELKNIFELVEKKVHPRSITSLNQYEEIMNEYVNQENPLPNEKWMLELEEINV